LLEIERALFLLLIWFLYAAILITTCQQYASNAEAKTDAKATSDALIMSVGATPLSIYLIFYLMACKSN
jgi:hypothetical protein